MKKITNGMYVAMRRSVKKMMYGVVKRSMRKITNEMYGWVHTKGRRYQIQPIMYHNMEYTQAGPIVLTIRIMIQTIVTIFKMPKWSCQKM